MRLESNKFRFTLLLILTFFISADGYTINIGRNWQISQLISILLFGLIIIEVLLRNRKVLFDSKILALLLLFLVNIFFSNLIMPESPKYVPVEKLSYWQSFGITSYMYLMWIVLNIIMLIVIYNSIWTRTELIKVIRILIYSSAIFSCYGFFQYATVAVLGESGNSIVFAANEEYLREGYIRLLSFGREPLYYACFLNVIIGLMISGIYLKKSGKIFGIDRKKFIVIFVLNIFALLLTKSLGAIVGLTGLLFVFSVTASYLSPNANKFKLFSIFLIILFFVFGFILLNYTLVESKVSRMLNPSSGYGRIISLIEGVELLKEKYLGGIGMGNSVFFVSNHQIHNAYLNIAVELGMTGILIFGAFLTIIIKRTLRVAKKSYNELKIISLGLLLGLVAILIQLLSFYGYMINIIWYLFALCLVTVKIYNSEMITLKLARINGE